MHGGGGHLEFRLLTTMFHPRRSDPRGGTQLTAASVKHCGQMGSGQNAVTPSVEVGAQRLSV